MIGGWRDSVAAADFADWLTVAAYLVAAALGMRAAAWAGLKRQPQERLFWQGSSVALSFLAVNELLDLQTLLTDLGRANARAMGWYDIHRTVQYYFVGALALAAIVGVAALLKLTRRTHFAVRLALGGLAFIVVFILFRAASFHHVDELLGAGLRWFNWGSVQELAGIAIMAAAALLYRGHRTR